MKTQPLKHAVAVLGSTLAVGLYIMVSSCTLDLSSSVDSVSDGGIDPLHTGGVLPDAGQTQQGADSGQAAIEICDSWDNDGDGLIDEETDGEACETETGDEGVTVCQNGSVICQSCAPGDRREVECGCEMLRVDVCSPQGTWMEGACDGCMDEPLICECNIGELKIERCDTCDSEDCGTTCVGAEWRCNQDCKWEQIGECQSMNPECSRDEMAVEQCGHCGSRVKSCDGCFWDFTECEDQGECTQGAVKQAPCTQNGCREGTWTTLTCDRNCRWKAASCNGCEIDTVKDSTKRCVQNADCGNYNLIETCGYSHTMQLCNGAQSMDVGRVVKTEIVGECPTPECIPGAAVESCTTASGAPGTREIACSNQCELLPPVECDPGGTTCPDGARTVTPVPCGCGISYNSVETCAGGGTYWQTTIEDREECPECKEGDTKPSSCTTDVGACGTRTLRCQSDCTWPDESAVDCRPLPQGCEPGVVENHEVSCGANTCGLTIHQVRQCYQSGCGWQVLSSDASDCPICRQGEEQDTGELCRPNVPECGTKKRICNDRCEWEVPACPPCQG